MTPKKHLTLAKRDIARGTASFRSAANHIAAAIKAGATQAEAAAKVGKSQPWVNRLLKWRENGFKGDSPFAADHARAIISAANNPPETRTVQLKVIHEAVRIAAPYTRMPVPQSEQPKIVRLNVTQEPEPAPADQPLDVVVKLEALETAVKEIGLSVQLYGGIDSVGEDARRRIMAVVHKLWALADHPAVRRFS